MKICHNLLIKRCLIFPNFHKQLIWCLLGMKCFCITRCYGQTHTHTPPDMCAQSSWGKSDRKWDLDQERRKRNSKIRKTNQHHGNMLASVCVCVTSVNEMICALCNCFLPSKSWRTETHGFLPPTGSSLSRFLICSAEWSAGKSQSS